MKGGIRGLVIGSFVGGAAHVLIEKYLIKTGILYVYLNANFYRITNRGLIFRFEPTQYIFKGIYKGMHSYTVINVHIYVHGVIPKYRIFNGKMIN